jgi:hypothetical protein
MNGARQRTKPNRNIRNSLYTNGMTQRHGRLAVFLLLIPSATVRLSA